MTNEMRELADRLVNVKVYTGDDLRGSIYRSGDDPKQASRDCSVILVSVESRDLIVAALRAQSDVRAPSPQPSGPQTREALKAAKVFADDEFGDCSDLPRKARISALCDKIDAALAALPSSPAPSGPITTEQLDHLQFGRALHDRPSSPAPLRAPQGDDRGNELTAAIHEVLAEDGHVTSTKDLAEVLDNVRAAIRDLSSRISGLPIELHRACEALEYMTKGLRS